MKAIAWAFERQEKPGPKWVLICLAWHADKTTWRAKPGVPLILRETGLKARAVAQHLDALERSGLIQRERRFVVQGPAKGKRISDEFLLLGTEQTLPANPAVDLSANSADRDAEAARTFRKDHPQFTPTLPADSASAYIRIEPSKEPNGEPRRPAAAAAADKLESDIEYLFDLLGYTPSDHPELFKSFLADWPPLRAELPLDLMEDVVRHALETGRPRQPARSFKWFVQYARKNAAAVAQFQAQFAFPIDQRVEAEL